MFTACCASPLMAPSCGHITILLDVLVTVPGCLKSILCWQTNCHHRKSSEGSCVICFPVAFSLVTIIFSFYIIGDSAFYTKSMKEKLRCCLSKKNRRYEMAGAPPANLPEDHLRLHAAIVQIRQAAEWGMGAVSFFFLLATFENQAEYNWK